MSRRLLVVALAAVGLMGAAAPAAKADVTVPGCYGVSTVICDPTLSGVETYKTTIPVCAGTCTDVPVTLIRTSSGYVCVTYRDRSPYSSPHYKCVDRYDQTTCFYDGDGNRSLCFRYDYSPRQVCYQAYGIYGLPEGQERCHSF